MKSNTIKYIKGLFIITVLFALGSCGKPKNLKFGLLSNVSVKNMTFSGIDLQATIPIENPNSYQMSIKDADMNLLADDRAVAHIKQNLPVIIPGNSKGDYILNVTVDLLNKGEILSIMNLFNGGSNLNLDGTVKVKSLLFTKNVMVHETGIQNFLKPAFDKMKLF